MLRIFPLEDNEMNGTVLSRRLMEALLTGHSGQA